MTQLDSKLASHMAQIALGHVTREFPHKLDHVLVTSADAQTPRALHPVFFGSFDWHSCVHGWWTLLTLKRLFPQLPQSPDIEALADESFAPDKIAAERAYLERPHSRGFERPYGWAWLLQLHLEATRHETSWAGELEPLAFDFSERLQTYLDVMTYPIRVGTHFNTSFALVLALDWAETFNPALHEQICNRALHWFAADRDCQAWEPGGDEFLSPALIEALCMARTHPAEFRAWFAHFLPSTAERRPASLFECAVVSDRSDGKIAHLDGLNLSRSWCWSSIAPLLPNAERTVAEAAAQTHLSVALPHLAGDYMGEHWLASFALLALLSSSDVRARSGNGT